jgi:hypothetical protein
VSNGDSRWSSRKFAIAGASFLAATFALVWGLTLCKDAQDIAIVIGAWGLVDAAILKLYSDANLKAAGP